MTGLVFPMFKSVADCTQYIFNPLVVVWVVSLPSLRRIICNWLDQLQLCFKWSTLEIKGREPTASEIWGLGPLLLVWGPLLLVLGFVRRRLALFVVSSSVVMAVVNLVCS